MHVTFYRDTHNKNDQSFVSFFFIDVLAGRMGMAGGRRRISGPGADDRPAAGLWSHGRSNRPPLLPSRIHRSFFTPHGSRSVLILN